MHKRICLFAILAVFTLPTIVLASDAHLFDYDSDAITKQFAEIDRLEQQLLLLGESDFYKLMKASPNLQSMLPPVAFQVFDDSPVAFPMCWGCFLGPVGWGYVLVATNRSREPSANAFKGCVVSSTIYSIIGYIGYRQSWFNF